MRKGRHDLDPSLRKLSHMAYLNTPGVWPPSKVYGIVDVAIISEDCSFKSQSSNRVSKSYGTQKTRNGLYGWVGFLRPSDLWHQRCLTRDEGLDIAGSWEAFRV